MSCQPAEKLPRPHFVFVIQLWSAGADEPRAQPRLRVCRRRQQHVPALPHRSASPVELHDPRRLDDPQPEVAAAHAHCAAAEPSAAGM